MHGSGTPLLTGSQLDGLDFSFLSPLKSCKSPSLFHVRSSPVQLSPAPSLSCSPAMGVQSLAHAFKQVGLVT